MSPFISLKKSSQYGGSEDYLVNVNHIVRIVQSSTGSQVYMVSGDFACDENPATIKSLIVQMFNRESHTTSDN